MTRTAILLATFLFNVCFSQNIKRQGAFGILLYNKISDSLGNAIGITQKQGALVKEVLENSTAQKIGLKKFDLITNINGKTKVESAKDVYLESKYLREGDKICVGVVRGKATPFLCGEVVGKPKETSSEMNIEYGEFAFENTFVRTIFKSPKNKAAKGTIYFLQGIGCYSLDNMQKKDPTKQGIDEFVKLGYNVYFVEKLGMGDSYYNCSCNQVSFNKELDVYTEGYKNLLNLKSVNKETIFLFGHSLGGVVAPLVAEKFHPKGIIVYGTGFKPWSEYLFDAYLIQPQYFGADLAQLRDTLEQCKPYIFDYFYGRKSIDEISKTKKGLHALQTILGFDTTTNLCAAERTGQFHKEINQHNLAKAWKNTRSNVLAIYGEADLAANNADDHKGLVNYYNSIYPDKAKFWLYPKTNHGFQEIGTMADYVRMQENPTAYQNFAADHFNAKLFLDIAKWLTELNK